MMLNESREYESLKRKEFQTMLGLMGFFNDTSFNTENALQLFVSLKYVQLNAKFDTHKTVENII